MGCRLTRNKAKTLDAAHRRPQKELLFVDEYWQPLTVHVEDRRGRGHRRQWAGYGVSTEKHWEALGAIGMMEEEEGHRGSYAAGPYFGHMAVSPDLYAASHMMMSSDVYPTNGYLSRALNDQQTGNHYLPSVSYSLDHLDRLDYKGQDISPYQPNSESCLIGCYKTEEVEPKTFPREVDYTPPWRSHRVPGYLPLSELESGLGCGPDSPSAPFSEAETDAMSSLPGHTPSSQGSSSSSESLVSSEPSDSGFHSVSTGEHRRLHKLHAGHAHRQTHHLRSGHSPLEQRGRWDLESIPETAPVAHSGAPQASRCTVGNSTTTTVHFHRAERSPTLPRPPPSPAQGCRTEPCQRRALWLEQQQGEGRTMEAPGRSRTMTDLSEEQRRRRASHPNTMDPNRPQNRPPGAASDTLGPRSRASYPSKGQPTSGPSTDRASLTSHSQCSNCRQDESLSKSPGSASSGASDCRGFQTLGSRTGNTKGPWAPFFSTLGAPPGPRSPRCRLSNQRSVRNQLLRARAHRLARERSELTTDEEARGDGARGGGEDGWWAGRYCSRTERRRHLAMWRQQRERRGQGEELVGGLQACQQVLELSHRKQDQLRTSTLLDGWTTVEELLTHGSRLEGPSPLLSVTTV